MSNYLVTHPQIGITATVDAPTSEKARTTFLDYLERTGKVSRKSRQLLRRTMATKKLVDGSEGYSDIELHYEYNHIPETQPLTLEEPMLEGSNNPDVSQEPPLGDGLTTEQGVPPPTARGLSPIQELALTGRTGG